MNKTAITIAFFVLVALAVLGGVVVLIVNPEAVATFTSLIVTVLGLATVGATTFYGFGKQSEQIDAQNTKIDTVVSQTNGNLSRVQTENERLTDILIAAGIDPKPVELVAVAGRHTAS